MIINQICLIIVASDGQPANMDNQNHEEHHQNYNDEHHNH